MQLNSIADRQVEQKNVILTGQFSRALFDSYSLAGQIGLKPLQI